jgi:hypothetical protein
VSTKFVQIKALGLKLALVGAWGGGFGLGRAYIQVSDLKAIMALLLLRSVPSYLDISNDECTHIKYFVFLLPSVNL